MTTRIYSTAHSDLLVGEKYTDTDANRINAALAESLFNRQYPNNTDMSAGQFIAAYLKLNWNKLTVLDGLLKFLMAKNCKRILSLGSGEAILEYMLMEHAKKEQYDLNVCASDICDLHVKTSNRLFPDTEYYKINFLENSVSQILDQTGEVDAILSFGSFYVMNDNELTQFLADFAKTSVPYIIDFHAGVILNKQEYLETVKVAESIKNETNKYRKEHPNTAFPSGVMFHGYSRMPQEIFKIYNNSGCWSTSEIFNISETDSYKFAVALERKGKE